MCARIRPLACLGDHGRGRQVWTACGVGVVARCVRGLSQAVQQLTMEVMGLKAEVEKLTPVEEEEDASTD